LKKKEEKVKVSLDSLGNVEANQKFSNLQLASATLIDPPIRISKFKLHGLKAIILDEKSYPIFTVANHGLSDEKSWRNPLSMIFGENFTP